jgi:uncharacterized membrane protein YkoI
MAAPRNRLFRLEFLGILAVTVASGCACCNDRDEKDQGTKITLADLPAPVRATLEKETSGGKVTEIEKETKGGKLVYSADAVVNGTAWDIEIAEDGTLIGKQKEK